MQKILILLGLCALCMGGCLGSCVGDQEVIRAVSNQGYTDVKVLDKSIMFPAWVGCSEEDAAAYELSVVNPLGKKVKILACAGWPFKGVTIRSK